MKIELEFPNSEDTYELFKGIMNFYENNEIFIIDYGPFSIICFHHSPNSSIPWEVEYELESNNRIKLFCCYPETLPMELRKKHIFPNGKGICSMLVPESKADGLVLTLTN